MKVICKTSFPWLLIKLPPRVLATSLKTNWLSTLLHCTLGRKIF